MKSPKLKPKRDGLDRSSEIVRLRRLSKRSLKHWTREMKRAEKDLRSGDERNARNYVVWLNGYLKSLDDVEQPNVKLKNSGPRTPDVRES